MSPPSDRELRVTKRTFVKVREEIEELLAKRIDTQIMAQIEVLFEGSLRVYADRFELAANEFFLLVDETSKEDTDLEVKVLADQSDVRKTFSLIQAKVKKAESAVRGEEMRKSILPNANSTLADHSRVPDQLKLKKIEVPEFDGDLSKFYNFKALFTNLVHNNSEFTNVQKLYYLKQALVGKASIVLQDCELADDAYPEAWSYVLDRYESKRAIVRTFFVKLSNLQPIRSETGIRDILDQTMAIIRGLKVAGETVDETFSRYIAFLVAGKLDTATAKDWENHTCSESRYPKFESLFEFLQGRTFVVDERKNEKPKEVVGPKFSVPKKSFLAASSGKGKCPMCNGAHFLNQCPTFKAMNAHRRFDFVKSDQRCLVCFEKDHSASSCKSNYKCRCGKPHHSLLHFEFKATSRDNEKVADEVGRDANAENGANEKKVFTNLVKEGPSDQKVVLLPSALVRFSSGKANGTIRILLNNCAQATMASDRLVRKYRLKTRSNENGSLLGGVTPGLVSCDKIVSLTLISRTQCFTLDIEAEVVPPSSMNYSICAETSKENARKLMEFPLADPAIAKKPISISDVDLILGAEYYGKCVGGKIERLGELFLMCSKFGWTVSGLADRRREPAQKFSALTLRSIDDGLKKYFNMENSIVKESQPKIEATKFVEHFNQTCRIVKDGKFSLKLPLKADRSKVKSNHKLALISLSRMEQRLQPKLKADYVGFMREYIALGHCSLAEPTDGPRYFIPHRCVVREESSTTPVRVVFNASSHERGAVSLNDIMMAGPQIQRDLFDILISVRSFRFIFTADVEKMYRMIWVDPKDRDLQRILWRESIDQPVREYRLNTVTYGTVSASFMATQCLEKIAVEIEKDHPNAAKLIRENFYMDDLIAGGDTLEQVKGDCKVIHNVLMTHGFRLRKYAANVQEILTDIAPELMVTGSHVELPESVGMLGVVWSPTNDAFCIKITGKIEMEPAKVTKRVMMSWLARVFDPLGLIAPVSLRGKLIIQALWKEGLDWDERAPAEIAEQFTDYMHELGEMQNFVIERYYFRLNAVSQIVGFCDASSRAFCAVVFLRAVKDGKVQSCNLVCAKTRVAPTKERTIPKLELSAALLLAQLIDRVRRNLKIDVENCFMFTDATIVLCWLSQEPDEWNCFVANRVKKVQELVPYTRWFYVNTRNNPADLATRGLSVSEFLCSKEWLHGPEFLKGTTILSNPIPNFDLSQALERRKKVASVNQVVSSSCMLDRFSSYPRGLRVLAYVIRFCKRSRRNRLYTSVEVSVEESQQALVFATRIVQRAFFFEDIDRISRNLALKAGSKLLPLAPFLDNRSLLRVGGRLNHSSLSESRKHPIILHARSQFVHSMVRWVHEKYFHAGPRFLVTFLASNYWIVGGCANLVKLITRQCVTCTRYRGEVASQLMGQLPPFRVRESRPFEHTGVDLAGPFQCKCVAHRSVRHYKIYVAIFVCMVVKCVHLEIVTDLSSAKFIEALQRFISRRGVPSYMYSDNGTNFVGTKNLLVEGQDRIKSFIASEGIVWSMIPPRSPHFGGIWEAAVRSAKFHFTRVNNGNVLSYDQYCTLVARVEAVLNSRPLCSSVKQGEEILTPGHFLVGRPLTSLPELETGGVTKSLYARLQETNNRLSSFWKSWRNDYLNQLQRRYKWQRSEPNLEIGQVVLLKDESPPFKWPLGVVVKVYPDVEGRCRVADIRVAGPSPQVFKRALAKIVLLPIDVTSEPLKGSAGGVCSNRCAYVYLF